MILHIIKKSISLILWIRFFAKHFKITKSSIHSRYKPYSNMLSEIEGRGKIIRAFNACYNERIIHLEGRRLFEVKYRLLFSSMDLYYEYKNRLSKDEIRSITQYVKRDLLLSFHFSKCKMIPHRGYRGVITCILLSINKDMYCTIRNLIKRSVRLDIR